MRGLYGNRIQVQVTGAAGGIQISKPTHELFDELRDVIEQHPFQRYAEPAEIAAGVAYLLSDDSSFVLGSAMMVDGGYSMA